MRVRGGVIAVLVAVVGWSGAVPAAQAVPQPPLPPLPGPAVPSPGVDAGALVGTVTSDGGADVGAVRVEVFRSGDGALAGHGTVGSAGSYRVDLDPGQYWSRVVDDSARHLTSYQPGGGLTRAVGLITVGEAATVRLDVRLRRGASLGGKVLGPKGRLMRDGVRATLEQRTAQGRWIPAQQPYWQPRFIGPDARWKFAQLRPGVYRVRFSASEWFTHVTKPVRLAAGQQVTKNPRMSFGARLTGRVKVSGGGAFSGHVTVYERVRTASGKVKLKVARSTVVDADHPGFRVARLRTGTYVVCGGTFDGTRTGCVGGRTPEQAKRIKVRKNQQKQLVLRLR